MADTKKATDTKAADKAPEVDGRGNPVADENSIAVPEAPQVVSQEGALVGDEAVQGPSHTVEPQVYQEQAAAQVAPAREGAADKVNVHETFVAMDRVITDPSSPEAVQIPDAGRGALDLPIHALGGRTVEDVFAEASKDAEDKKS